MMELRPYPAYRDSGVEWLGEVPGHWDSVAVKRRYSIQLGKMLQNRATESTDVEVPYLKAQHVQWFSVRTADAPKMWAGPHDVEQFGVRAGDLLVCEGGEGGRCGLLKDVEPGYIIQNALHRVRPSNNCRNDYLQYVMSSIAAIGWFDAINNKATIAHFTREKFGSLAMPLPPLPEQAAIVRFLDHVDRRVRRYVRAKQKLIGLLEEQKQAIIHRAVTRGLDPDVPLKSSGVEWLGDVPEHWEIKRAKYFYREIDERSSTGTEELMSVSHKTGVTPRKRSVTMFLAESNVGHKICRPGDLAINTMWAYMAALGVSRQVGIVSPSYGVYRPHDPERLSPDYIDRLLRTERYKAEYLCRSTGITSSRLRLYPDAFLRIPILCPPFSEQTAIVSYIEDAIADIDIVIDRARREIELLREYRTRLIADVATGKLDVREAAANLPEEPDEPEALHETDALGDTDEETEMVEELEE